MSPGDQRLCDIRAARLGQLERMVNPALDHLGGRQRREHPRPQCRVQREVRIEVGPKGIVIATGDRLLHRLPEPLTVVLEGAGLPERVQDAGSSAPVLFELERTAEEDNCVVELVASRCELAGAL